MESSSFSLYPQKYIVTSRACGIWCAPVRTGSHRFAPIRTGSHRFAPVRTDSFRAYRHTHMLACLCVLFSSVDVTSYLTSVDFPKDYTYRVSSFVQILGLQKKNQSSLLSDFLLITIVNYCEVSISSHCSTPKLCLLIPHLHHPLCSCAQPSLLL